MDLQEEFKDDNFCLRCNISMGEQNPRQLCGKTYCLYEYDNFRIIFPLPIKKKKTITDYYLLIKKID